MNSRSIQVRSRYRSTGTTSNSMHRLGSSQCRNHRKARWDKYNFRRNRIEQTRSYKPGRSFAQEAAGPKKLRSLEQLRFRLTRGPHTYAMSYTQFPPLFSAGFASDLKLPRFNCQV